MAKGKKKYDYRFPVSFGSFSSGKKRVGISVHMAAGQVGLKGEPALDRDDYWECFVQKLLKVGLEVDPNSKRDAKGQQTLLDGNSIVLDNIAEVVGFAVKSDGIGFKLSFTKGSGVDLAVLDQFVGMTGTLGFTVKGDAEKRSVGRPKSDDSDDEEPEEVDLP